jgi:hypothetical protein
LQMYLISETGLQNAFTVHSFVHTVLAHPFVHTALG